MGRFITRGVGRGTVRTLCSQRLTQTGKLLTPLRTVSTGFVTRDAEGPHLYNIKGWYYLIEAEGGTRFLHMETVGRSRSPWGPFERSPWNPWISQHVSWDDQEKSLGHCDLVDTAAGDWWTVCLGTRHFNSQTLDLGRETFLFPVTWKDGWPTIAAEDTQTLAVKRPSLPEHVWPQERTHDDFNGGLPGLEWNTIGPLGVKKLLAYRAARILATVWPARRDFFSPSRRRLWADGKRSGGPPQLSGWSLLRRRDGERAGLTVLMSPKFHYDLCETAEGGRLWVELVKQVGDMHEVANRVPVPAGPLLLRIESDPFRYQFGFAAQDGVWHEVGTGDVNLLAPELANVWTGMYIGMFSASSPSGAVPADFNWFDYNAEEREKR